MRGQRAFGAVNAEDAEATRPGEGKVPVERVSGGRRDWGASVTPGEMRGSEDRRL